jgi:hypothetical protein
MAGVAAAAMAKKRQSRMGSLMSNIRAGQQRMSILPRSGAAAAGGMLGAGAADGRPEGAAGLAARRVSSKASPMANLASMIRSNMALQGSNGSSGVFTAAKRRQAAAPVVAERVEEDEEDEPPPPPPQEELPPPPPAA